MEKIYYISQGITIRDNLSNIKNALDGGCKLIQLRLKDKSIYDYTQIALYVKELCENANAKLIINDSIEVAKASKADGVHLGKSDSTIEQARKILGVNAIIGGTANSYEDCISLANQNVDYIGLGPFRYTDTKKNLSSIIGFDGFIEITSKLNDSDFETPIFAIGGIELKNIEELSQCNIHGIAISNMMSYRSKTQIAEIHKQIKETLNKGSNKQ